MSLRPLFLVLRMLFLPHIHVVLRGGMLLRVMCVLLLNLGVSQSQVPPVVLGGHIPTSGGHVTTSGAYIPTYGVSHGTSHGMSYGPYYRPQYA